MAIDANKITSLIKGMEQDGFSIAIPSIKERENALSIMLRTKFLQPSTTNELWLAKDRMLHHPILLVKKNSTPVAFINFNIRNSEFGHKGYIRSVYVYPEFRGKGISKKIINIAELFLPKPWWMIIDSKNTTMLDNVRKLGYSKYKVLGTKVLVERR